MRPNFLVTGLPRSRTAWFAEFLPDCVHEPIVDFDEIADIRKTYEVYKGISDSGLGFWLDWILREVKPRTLIIERDIGEVEASLMAMGTNLPNTNFCELLKVELEKFRHHPLVMWVPFEYLDRNMAKIWFHLLPGIPFDEERFDIMRQKVVEVDVKEVMKTIRKDSIIKEIMPRIRIKEAA